MCVCVCGLRSCGWSPVWNGQIITQSRALCLSVGVWVGGLPALKRATTITKWRNNASQNVSFVFDCVTIQNLILNYLTGNPIFNFFFICFYCVEKLTLGQFRFNFCKLVSQSILMLKIKICVSCPDWIDFPFRKLAIHLVVFQSKLMSFRLSKECIRLLL